MKLESIKDMWTNTYTFFWRDANNKLIGPYFNSEQEAEEWLQENPTDGGDLDFDRGR